MEKVIATSFSGVTQATQHICDEEAKGRRLSTKQRRNRNQKENKKNAVLNATRKRESTAVAPGHTLYALRTSFAGYN